MEEFPSNARTDKTNYVKKTAEVKMETVVETEPEPEKKVEKIEGLGEVVVRKKPLTRRFMETFFDGHGKGVVGYVFAQVLVPAAKDAISDAVSQAVDRALFGDSRPSSRGGYRPASTGTTNYTRYSQPSQPTRREDPREASRYSRVRGDFDDMIVMATMVEANHVLERMDDLIRRYGEATVADLYDLVGKSGPYTNNKWGWKDLTAARVSRARGGGYVIITPEPQAL